MAKIRYAILLAFYLMIVRYRPDLNKTWIRSFCHPLRITSERIDCHLIHGFRSRKMLVILAPTLVVYHRNQIHTRSRRILHISTITRNKIERSQQKLRVMWRKNPLSRKNTTRMRVKHQVVHLLCVLSKPVRPAIWRINYQRLQTEHLSKAVKARVEQ